MKKLLGVVAGFLLACLPPAAQTQQPVRVNCGGPSYTDTNGQVWQADTGYNTGVTSTNTVVSRPGPAVQCSTRAIATTPAPRP